MHLPQPTERIALPRRLVQRQAPTNYDVDARYAYLEWLTMEARLLRMELGLERGGHAEVTPCGTFAKSFHFPCDERMSWRDVPPPSSRAEVILKAAGVEFPA